MEYLIGVLGLLILLLMIIIGVHIGISLGFIGILGLIFTLGLERTLSFVAGTAFHFTTSPALLALPCFILMGILAANTELAANAYGALRTILGRFPAGLAISTFVGTTVFGTVTGTAGGTSMVFTKIACPEMRQYGYEKRFAYGLVCAAGLSGMLIPPSALMVFYGINTGDSIGRLLFAGVGPGLLMDALFSLCAITMVLLKPHLAPRANLRFSWRERLLAVKDLWPVFIVGGTVLGGMYGGVFTPNEAAAWGVILVALVGLLRKKLGGRQLWHAVEESVGIMAMVFFIMITGQIFARFLAVTGVSRLMLDFILNTFPEAWQLIPALVLLYLVLGMFLDSFSIIVLTIPIIHPVIITMGIDPIWFAVVMILTLHAGMLTPPLGVCVFSSKAVAEADVSMEDIFVGVLPFLLMVVIVTALVIVFPPIATWLPDRMF